MSKSLHLPVPAALLLLAIASLTQGASAGEAPSRLLLTDGWWLQSSAKIQGGGALLSTTAFQPDDWHKATAPSTVMGCLVEDGVYPDPFFGMNLRSLPGMDYPIGANFSGRAMSRASPFKVSWWYRKEFRVTPPDGGQVWLNFDGINYRANVWLNGKLIADDTQVAGAYRTYEFNVSDAVLAGKTNILAVEVFAPEPNNLGLTWVDWNPAPPDKDMGLWRDVYVTTTGPVALRFPQVITKVDMPSLDTAHLTVSAEVRNSGSQPRQVVLCGKIGNIEFDSGKIVLAAHEVRQIEFTPDKFPQLNLSQPRLWWPSHAGPQNLYNLDLWVNANGTESDRDSIRFGIREATSELNDKGYRLFKINGKPILVRGGGWAPDLFLRSSAAREEQEIRYVKDMNLNAIRFEGKTESARFLELCDRAGIMVIAGWCCCDFWERWSQWKERDYAIAAQSLRDQLRRIRNHPSVITFWYGSDNPPRARAESNYLAVLKELHWPNSAQSSATGKPSPLGEPTGLRMTGPYEYVPPIYWYVDTTAGGAYSFNTETSPGPAIPPIESLRKMLPKDHLWPPDEFWSYHAGGGPFKHLDIFTQAMSKRLGAPGGVEDYARKAQLMAYDGERAMFEAYARNKYNSTGVIQWMMNNAWPSMIWHLYDYYLRPGGGYFGVKHACEPLHIQYSYDDRSVVAINGSCRQFKGLKATAKIYNLDMAEKSSQQATLDLPADAGTRVFVLPAPADLTPTYFARLTLEDASGQLLSDNFYWLSTQPDTLGEPKSDSDWYYTPTRQFADFTALNTLPQVEVNVSAKSEQTGNEETTRVTLENPAKSLAFFVHLKVNAGPGGEEILPVIWQDNYLSLLPGEKREVSATYAASLLSGAKPEVEVQGWNVPSRTLSAAPPAWPAKVFAPYAFIPKNFISISNCAAETGQKYFTLAFIISDPDGYPSWTGSRDLRIDKDHYSEEIHAIRALGGDVLISFGGEGGTEIAINTPDTAKLQEKYQSVIDQYHVTWLDFDIEGKALSKIEANQRRNQVLRQLQVKNPGLKISFTLPVNPNGMENESLVMLKDAVRQGVKIESVNIMTMDYGADWSRGRKMGDLAISASNASRQQTLDIDPAIRIGITPMIGQNDQKGEIFTIEDAKEVMAFATKTEWVRSVGFWSSNRDRAKGVRKGGNHNSGIEQQPWEFTAIFKPLSE